MHAQPGMTTHPVRLRVETPAQLERAHVIIRLALLIALGAIGGSSLYWLLYLALPALAALLISSKGPERYLAEDASRAVPVLRWLAAAYAYLWLLTDAVPSREPGGPVELEIDLDARPTVGSALLRLLYSLPPLVLLALLSIPACLLWVIGAIAILVRRRVPRVIADFFAMVLRYQFRLVAYHLSLFDRYPSFAEAPLAPVTHPGAV